MLQAENDLVLKRIHELEEQLEDLKSKNGQLSDELLKKSGNKFPSLFWPCFTQVFFPKLSISSLIFLSSSSS